MKRVLELSLPENRIVWALSNPFGLGYIQDRKGVGVQKDILILSRSDTKPTTIVLEDYPKWAQNMIKSSIMAKEIINTGDPIDLVEGLKDLPKKTIVETTESKPTQKIEVKPKSRTKKSNK